MKVREKKRSSSWDLYAVAAIVLLTVLFILSPPLDQTPVRMVLGLASPLWTSRTVHMPTSRIIGLQPLSGRTDYT